MDSIKKLCCQKERARTYKMYALLVFMFAIWEIFKTKQVGCKNNFKVKLMCEYFMFTVSFIVFKFGF